MGHCVPEDTAPAADACTPEHAAMGHCTRARGTSATVGVAATARVLAATYRTPLFEGSYQGTELGANVTRGRFAAALSLAGYRLVRNGRASNGIGDLMLHLHAQAATGRGFAGGVMMMASAPTGDDTRGFGMGHVMLMPELWGTWRSRALSLSVAAGYGHALGGAQAHAEHGGGGSWPLVGPMNAREVTFGGTASYALAPSLAIGLSATGATPIGDGRTRLVTGGRIMWTLGSTVTSAEIAGGVIGDPFGIRGVISTTVPLR
jgi:hypothetical protein